MDKYGLGNFLAQLRNEKGLTQEQLAEMINVNYKTISKWECGNSTPSLDTLAQLCEIYDVSLYEMSIYQKIKNPFISKNDIKKIINKQSITKYIILKIILIIFLIALITFTTYSGIYTINNYDQMKVYELASNDKSLGVEGLFFKSKDNYYLSISKIEYLNKTDDFIKNETKLLKYSIIIKNKMIESKTKHFDKKLSVKEALESIKIYISNEKLSNDTDYFEIKIDYEENNGKEITNTFQIQLSQQYSNNKLFY